MLVFFSMVRDLIRAETFKLKSIMDFTFVLFKACFCLSEKSIRFVFRLFFSFSLNQFFRQLPFQTEIRLYRFDILYYKIDRLY